jgi:8-oxo-dGTP diphosphatase
MPRAYNSASGIYASCIEGVDVAVKKHEPPQEQDGPGSEAAFLATYDAGQYPHPSVAVDAVVLAAVGGALRVALYLRREHPSKNRYALPGGFVRMDESLDDAAARLLRDKAGLADVFIEQLYTFGAPGRDPRGRVIAVAYYALVDPRRFEEINQAKGARAAVIHVPWEGEIGGPVEVRGEAGERLPLAFDHAEIIGMVVKRLRGKLDYAPVGFQLLPAEFTLRALQDVHEAVRGAAVNKDSFRRRLLATGQLEATGAYERDTAHRPAELYRCTQRAAR